MPHPMSVTRELVTAALLQASAEQEHAVEAPQRLLEVGETAASIPGGEFGDGEQAELDCTEVARAAGLGHAHCDRAVAADRGEVAVGLAREQAGGVQRVLPASLGQQAIEGRGQAGEVERLFLDVAQALAQRHEDVAVPVAGERLQLVEDATCIGDLEAVDQAGSDDEADLDVTAAPGVGPQLERTAAVGDRPPDSPRSVPLGNVGHHARRRQADPPRKSVIGRVRAT
ncbi:hypothetical protein [Nannocystis pusilla]|uniref:hypothetical protein n=1 Tax=Nannocystis pusilla TaxID=889268 RepID=UPI003B760CA3